VLLAVHGLMLAGAWAHAQPVAVLRMQSIGYSEPIAFKQFVDKWRPATFRGGTTALAHSRVELGFERGPWYFSVSEQDHATAVFSNDTAEFYLLTKNKQALDPTKTYNIDLRYNRATFLALRGVYRFSRRHWSGYAGISTLFGQSFTSGRLHGQVTPQSDRNYDFGKVYLNYHYSDDELFERRVAHPLGVGLGLDAGLRWQWRQRLSLQADIENAPAYMVWVNAPATRARIDTDNKSFDDNGYVDVKPALSGRHTKSHFSQALPVMLRLASDLRFDWFHQVNRVFYTRAMPFYYAGFGVGPQDWRVNALYEIQTHAYRFAWEHRYLTFELIADHDSIGKLKHFGLQCVLKIPFN